MLTSYKGGGAYLLGWNFDNCGLPKRTGFSGPLAKSFPTRRIMSPDPRVLRVALALAHSKVGQTPGPNPKCRTANLALAPPTLLAHPRGLSQAPPPTGLSKPNSSGLTYMGAESLRGVSTRDAQRLHLHLDIVLQTHHLGLAGVELPGGALLRGHPGLADVIVPRGQGEAGQEESQQAQHGCAVRREALEKQRLDQAALAAPAWKCHICQAIEARCPRDSSDAAEEEQQGACFFQKADTENSEPAFLRLLMGRSESCPQLGVLLTLALHLPQR